MSLTDWILDVSAVLSALAVLTSAWAWVIAAWHLRQGVAALPTIVNGRLDEVLGHLRRIAAGLNADQVGRPSPAGSPPSAPAGSPPSA